MDAVALPQALAYFFEVPEALLHRVEGCFTLSTMSKGEFWLQEGDPVRKLGFIESGLVRVYKTLDDKEITQWISTPGYFLTDIAGFYQQQPSRWAIQALTPVRMWGASADSLQQLTTDMPEWQTLELRFIIKCFAMLEDRIFRHLHQTAEERYLSLLAFAPELVNQVPLQYLASMLGMTQETLSRVRAKK